MIKLKGRPISKKNNKRIFFKYGRAIVIPSKAYKKYLDSCLDQLVECKENHKGHMSIKCVFNLKGKGRVDVDNLITSILDILQDANIIDDDNNVMEMNVKKVIGQKEYETIIEIDKVD